MTTCGGGCTVDAESSKLVAKDAIVGAEVESKAGIEATVALKTNVRSHLC